MVWLILLLRYCNAVALICLDFYGVAFVLGVVELLSAGLGTLNALAAKERDTSWLGMAVGLSYLLGGLMRPDGSSSGFVDAVAICFALLRLPATAWLGASYSVYSPTLLRVVETGPYAVVRHPLTALHWLSRVVLLAAWPSWFNLACVASTGFFAVVASLGEEKFLCRVSEAYRDYCGRVRFRFLPYVW
jgi:protein-S-isoprenylcysteine O-methyltransferase Ste14